MADRSVKIFDQTHGDGWTLWHGDAIEIARGIPNGTLHYSIHSPPFCSLYTFSDDPRDVSNTRNDAEFWQHYEFLIADLHRATMPGRLASIHCMNLPTSKLRDGFIGLRDFRGDIIRAFERAGFIYHSEVCIRKDPVSAMQRTKALGLLHKQIVKDSSLSRMAIPDYVVTMRKLGDNPEPVAGPFDVYYGSEAAPDAPLTVGSGHRGHEIVRPGDPWYSVAVWQRYAEPVWNDIDQNDVLSFRMARDEKDERHIAPLQLTPIRRCIALWTNPGDVVFDPFGGIGSAPYVAVEMGRRGLMAELKESYYRQAVANMRHLEANRGDLFSAGAA